MPRMIFAMLDNPFALAVAFVLKWRKGSPPFVCHRLTVECGANHLVGDPRRISLLRLSHTGMLRHNLNIYIISYNEGCSKTKVKNTILLLFFSLLLQIVLCLFHRYNNGHEDVQAVLSFSLPLRISPSYFVLY